MRIGGTLAGFLAALVLLDLVAGNSTLAFILAMGALLPAMFLMPVNYGAAVAFITCTVSMMYAVSGEEADFLRHRVADNLVGVAVVCGVGVVLWRTSRADWWRVARLTAGSLAAAIASADPTSEQRETGDRAGLAAQLRAIEEHCTPDGTTDTGPPRAPESATRAGIDVARMTTAIALLHQQGTASLPRME